MILHPFKNDILSFYEKVEERRYSYINTNITKSLVFQKLHINFVIQVFKHLKLLCNQREISI